MDTRAPDSASAVLADLVAAGLVSHEMVVDADKISDEAVALRGLCALVSGSVYRVDAWHYAFPVTAADMDGRLGDLPPGDWTDALQEALTASLGQDAVWLNATDVLPDSAGILSRPLAFLRAHDGAVNSALTGAGAELQAIVNARYATECAHLTAGAGESGDLAARLDAIEATQAEILARLDRPAGPMADSTTVEKLTKTLGALLHRIDAQSELLHEHIAQEDRVSAQLAELSELATAPADFQESLGLTFAEFLARMERQSEQDRAAMQVPRFS
ncbi:hypothetical protein [Amaricoccus tamworthensis]|uniref:hypothetical protein n=1 Tax=Amaricoccus tamworthensis TaxID=57002 RepID=UPI003C7E4E24